jgi:hypothetical protein
MRLGQLMGGYVVEHIDRRRRVVAFACDGRRFSAGRIAESPVHHRGNRHRSGAHAGAFNQSAANLRQFVAGLSFCRVPTLNLPTLRINDPDVDGQLDYVYSLGRGGQFDSADLRRQLSTLRHGRDELHRD